MTQAPAWILDLLGIWASNERQDRMKGLGWDTVSPMFARAGVDFERVSDGSYGSTEVVALRAAIEEMAKESPEACKLITDWAKSGSQEFPTELDAAAEYLANRVDELLK